MRPRWREVGTSFGVAPGVLVLRVCLACTAVALVLGLASGCQSTDDALSDADAGDSVPDASAPSTSDASTQDAVAARKSLRVLFIGNSYTYVNDVPGILTRIAATATTGPTIAIDQVLLGGATLQNHWDAGIAQARIAQGHWTHVIVQGQSTEPTSSDNTSFMSNAKKFGDLATSAGARATWFVTWARGKEEFDPTVAETSATRMQDELTFAYAESMRQVPGSLLACVGEAFRTTLRDHPEIVLHQGDHSHAGMAGSCVLN